MSELYIQTVSMSKYGSTAKPSGHITLAGSGMSTTITLTQDDAEELNLLAIRIFERRQQGFANQILAANVQLSLAAPNGLTIDLNDEIPF